MILAIYGTGGGGSVAHALAEEAAWDEVLFIDDTKESGVFENCSMMPFGDLTLAYAPEEVRIHISLGEPHHRELLARRIRERGYRLASLIHPGALISPSARIGKGAMIHAGAMISEHAVIGDNVCIHPNAIIGHDVAVGEHSQICSGVFIGGHTIVGKCAFIGASASLRDHLHIGAKTVVSMGAVVLQDVPPGRMVMGNPAREVSNDAEFGVFHPAGGVPVSEKYDRAFMETFHIGRAELVGLGYGAAAWDSVGHFRLVVALEEAFSIRLEPEDIFSLTTYESGKEILRKYGVGF